jgi:beta-RFAP synthase
MVDQPGVTVRVQPAPAWSADGPLAQRALDFAHKIVRTLPPDQRQPYHLHIEQAAPEHMGLGTGTQLGLAVARAITTAAGWPALAIDDLARRIERGRRSALGIHGFAHGGFLVDGGKRTADDVAPLVARVAVPETWRILLVLPPWAPGLHGDGEGQAFERLRTEPATPGLTDRLCRLVLLGMLPALIERDLEGFGEAVYDFNRRVGELFAPVQGGCYAQAGVADLVSFLRRQGIRGVGQSSWGPSVFAVVGAEDQATALVRLLRKHFALQPHEVLACRPSNHGADITAA